MPKYLAVAPLATMTESRGRGLGVIQEGTRPRSQSTPVTMANRKVTLGGKSRRWPGWDRPHPPDSSPAVATS